MGGGDPSTAKSSEMQELLCAGKGMNMLGSTHVLCVCFLSYWLKGLTFCVRLTTYYWKLLRGLFIQCPWCLLWRATELSAEGNVKSSVVSRVSVTRCHL